MNFMLESLSTTLSLLLIDCLPSLFPSDRIMYISLLVIYRLLRVGIGDSGCIANDGRDGSHAAHSSSPLGGIHEQVLRRRRICLHSLQLRVGHPRTATVIKISKDYLIVADLH